MSDEAQAGVAATIVQRSLEGGVLRPDLVVGADPVIEAPSLRVSDLRSIWLVTVPQTVNLPQDREAGLDRESGGGIPRFRCHLR